MCLGIPGRILSIEAAELRMGVVAFAGITKSVCLACVPEAEIGDYVIVHVGIAVGRLDPIEAERTLALFKELGELGEATPGEPSA
jgi:hydrogenase expression/formation protein HypC